MTCREAVGSGRVVGWGTGTGVVLGAAQSLAIGKVDAGPGWWAAAVACTLLVAVLAGWLASQTLDPPPPPWAWVSRAEASNPNNLGTRPVGITAPSPCYAGGGWSYIAMLAQAPHGTQNQNDLKKDLEWLYGESVPGSAPLRSDEVQQMWISHSDDRAAYLMYEQTALDILANDQVRDGAIFYPDPPAEAEHWIIARKTGDPGHDKRMQTLVDLLTTAIPDARAVRQRQAQRYAIRFPDVITRDDPVLRGAFQEYLDTKLSGRPAANAVISTTALNSHITADTPDFRGTSPDDPGVITTQAGNLCQLH